jgi:hypothetical protein
VHFWGNLIGDSGTSTPTGNFQTTSTDAAQVFATLAGSAAITDLRDYNRDGGVSSTDATIVFANIGTIQRLNIGAGGPFAPEAITTKSSESALSALASALSIPRLADPPADQPPRLPRRSGADSFGGRMVLPALLPPVVDSVHARTLDAEPDEVDEESHSSEADWVEPMLLGSLRSCGTLP